jgi:hypothetical protein
MKHKTKDGKLIDLKDLELHRLKKIIKKIKRKAIKGTFIEEENIFGGRNFSDKYIVGKEVKDHFNYEVYKQELKRRKYESKQNSVTDFFKTIDWKLLQEQKIDLIKLCWDLKDSTNKRFNGIDGVINFITSFQDFAVDKLNYKESEIYNLE